MAREFALYSHPEHKFENGRWVEYSRPPKEVRVMCRAEGYAMVRYPGCAPFVVKESTMSPVDGLRK